MYRRGRLRYGNDSRLICLDSRSHLPIYEVSFDIVWQQCIVMVASGMAMIVGPIDYKVSFAYLLGLS